MSVLVTHSDDTFIQFLHKIREVLREAYYHKIVSQEDIVNRILKTDPTARFGAGRLTTWLDAKQKRAKYPTTVTKENSLVLYKVALKLLPKVLQVCPTIELIPPDEAFKNLGEIAFIKSPVKIEVVPLMTTKEFNSMNLMDIMGRMDVLKEEIEERKNEYQRLSEVVVESTKDYIIPKLKLPMMNHRVENSGLENTQRVILEQQLVKLVSQHEELIIEINEIVDSLKQTQELTVLKDAELLISKFS